MKKGDIVKLSYNARDRIWKYNPEGWQAAKDWRFEFVRETSELDIVSIKRVGTRRYFKYHKDFIEPVR